MSPTLHTLPELVAGIAADMAGWPDPGNGQVRAVPNERTLRWYGTIGLLDRPLSWRGRTALYGERHRRQALAIKRLQLAGWPIAAIQQRLIGADDAALAALLHGSLDGLPIPQPTPDQPTPAPRARTPFWAAAPTTAPAPAVASPATATPPPVPPHATRLHLDLGHGADLVLPPGLAADPDLDAALAPLRAWLARSAPR